jgi:hypothetical protein
MKLDFSRKNLVGLVIVLLILVLVWVVLKNQRIEITTDKTAYDNGGTLKAKIKNLSLRNVCFSSCYPYYLERRNGEWEPYDYQNCPHPDLAEKCFGLLAEKSFEILLPKVKGGTHRIAVPVCVNCEAGGGFREEEEFYSNEFIIE